MAQGSRTKLATPFVPRNHLILGQSVACIDSRIRYLSDLERLICRLQRLGYLAFTDGPAKIGRIAGLSPLIDPRHPEHVVRQIQGRADSQAAPIARPESSHPGTM